MKDITYCNRDCANYKCRRNEKHLDKTDYAFYGIFKNCDEYIKPKGENNAG